nr:MAG TPA: hypothetical protein [Caudoviricetes sp.]
MFHYVLIHPIHYNYPPSILKYQILYPKAYQD